MPQGEDVIPIEIPLESVASSTLGFGELTDLPAS